MVRYKALLSGAVALLGLAGCGVAVWSRAPRSPEDAVRQFYDTTGKMEDQIMDPLILAGPKVVPLLNHDVQSKDMPGRRYAILALGHIGDRRALATLKKILDDPNEVPLLQGDALEAIALIDSAAGQDEARRYRGSEVAALAQASRRLLSGRGLKRQTFISTLVGLD